MRTKPPQKERRKTDPGHWLRQAAVLALFPTLLCANPDPTKAPCETRWADLEARASKPLSSNLQAPHFELGRDKTTLEAEPLRAEEAKLLSKAGLTLFPSADVPRAEAPAEQFDEWATDLDAYLKVNRSNPAVQELVHRFLVDYVNHPPNGSLPGDSQWTTPRRISDWRDLYRMPREYDLAGNLLLLAETNLPVHSAPTKISGAELESAPKLIDQMYGNLRNVLGFVELIRDGTYKGDKALAKTAAMRRQHLTLRLLQEGEFYLGQEKASK